VLSQKSSEFKDVYMIPNVLNTDGDALLFAALMLLALDLVRLVAALLAALKHCIGLAYRRRAAARA
jgi:uncharacterized Tic20 family protein